MKFKVDMYVRTKHKGILPLLSNDKEHYYFGKDRNNIKLCCLKKDIGMFLSLNKMPSHNIIDLIEVGDVLAIKENIDNFKQTFILGVYEQELLDNIKIKLLDGSLKIVGVLTREQFEREVYKV